MPEITYADVQVGDVVQINSKCLEITAIDRKECLKSGQIKVRLTGDYAEGPKQGKECREVFKSATRTLVLYSRDGDDVETESDSEDEDGFKNTDYYEKQALVLQKRGVVGADGLTEGERAAEHIQEIADEIDPLGAAGGSGQRQRRIEAAAEEGEA
jgi:hypothetical protein